MGRWGKSKKRLRKGGEGASSVALDATQGFLLLPEKTKAPEKEGGRNEGGEDHRWSTTDHPSKRKRAHSLSPQICLLERKMYFGKKNCCEQCCTMIIEPFCTSVSNQSKKKE